MEPSPNRASVSYYVSRDKLPPANYPRGVVGKQESPGCPQWEELFDLLLDPGELVNLAEEESARPTLLLMRASLVALDGEAGERPAMDGSQGR